MYFTEHHARLGVRVPEPHAQALVILGDQLQNRLQKQPVFLYPVGGVLSESSRGARTAYVREYAGFLESVLDAHETVLGLSLTLLELGEKCVCGRIWDGQAQCMCNLDEGWMD